jgi:hypothetical protein
MRLRKLKEKQKGKTKVRTHRLPVDVVARGRIVRAYHHRVERWNVWLTKEEAKRLPHGVQLEVVRRLLVLAPQTLQKQMSLRRRRRRR